MKQGNAPGVGVAGRTGEEARSDIQIRFELRTSGGIEIELASKVMPYYGDAIREQAREVLAELGVEHGQLAIQDSGALPFTIAARIEAAVRRAGIGSAATAGATGSGATAERAARPANGGRADGSPAETPSRGPSARDRLRRSRLYLPGNEPKFMVSAGLHEPDAIILDLEDSVHPAEKDTARLLVRNALRTLDFGPAERMVRINQLPLGLEDLQEIVPQQPDLILLPKVESPAQVVEVDRRIRELMGAAAQERPVCIMPILETALGIERAFDIAQASRRVVALTIGLEDYTADLGVPRTAQGEESRYARQRLVNAARAAGLQAIDSVYGDVGDLEGLRAWGERSRGLGFEGMGCLHPRQIEVIHAAFAPGAAEIERALKIMEAYEQAHSRGLGVTSLGSRMIDPPVVQRALRLVTQARAMGVLPEVTP